MKRRAFALAPLGCLLLAAGLLADQPAQQQPPTDWIDAATGHRVIRLSPDGGGSSLYFHQNTYTPEGDKLIFNSKGGIVAVDLTKLGEKPPRAEVIVQGASAIATARKTREVYFSKGKGGGVYAAHVDSKEVRTVKNARGGTINADETFSVVATNAVDPTGKAPRPEPRKLLPQRERMFGDKIKLGIALTLEEEASAKKEDNLARRLADPTSMAFVFTDLKSGESKTVGYQYAWLNQLLQIVLNAVGYPMLNQNRKVLLLLFVELGIWTSGEMWFDDLPPQLVFNSWHDGVFFSC